MLARYNAQDPLSLDRALREIIQEIALVGLWRAKFFTKAAFYTSDLTFVAMKDCIFSADSWAA